MNEARTTQPESQHTPGPWEVWDGNRVVTRERPPRNIAEISGRTAEENQANAAFIVRAVNAHADLLRELERMVAAENPADESYAEARAAIAKAKGQPK